MMGELVSVPRVATVYSMPGKSHDLTGAAGCLVPQFGLRQENESLRQRISNTENKASSTLRHMVAAVKSFERWLLSRPYGDTRKLEEIPPAQLDTYLVDYFTTIKKPSGVDYNYFSLTTLRSSLEHYLRDHSYPCSITKSPEFNESQLAFKRRKENLRNAAAAMSTSENQSSL